MPMRETVWVAGITIGLDIMDFLAEDGAIDALKDALLDVPDATEVEGPWAAHGVVVVTFKQTEEPAARLRTRVATVRQQCLARLKRRRRGARQ